MSPARPTPAGHELTTVALPGRLRSGAGIRPVVQDYRLIKPIGQGAYGTVWLAE